MSWDCMNCERANVDRATKCIHCDEPKPDRKASSALDTCERCGTVSKSVSAFHPDDHETWPEDRGTRLCGGCWIPALKRRATCPHERAKGNRDAEKCLGCQQIITEMRQQFRKAMATIEARNVQL